MRPPRLARWIAIALGITAIVGAGCNAIQIRTPVAIRDAPPSSRPPIRGISAVAFHGGALWLHGVNDSLAEVDLARGTVSYPLARDRVAAIHRSLDDKLWVLGVNDLDVHVWERVDGGFRSVLGMLNPGMPLLAITDFHGRPVILGRSQIFTLDEGGSLRSSWLSQEIAPGYVAQMAFAVTGGGVAYAGTNSGEWGGSLFRIDLSSGEVTRIQRVDSADLCAGPLNPNCDPVTSVIADPDAPSCVVAGVGLRHMGMETGRLVRVCDAKVSVVALEEAADPIPPKDLGALDLKLAVFFGERTAPIKPPPGRCAGDAGDCPPPPPGEGLGEICAIDPSACPAAAPEDHKRPRLDGKETAIFGLSPTRHGYWMVTGEALYFVQGNRARRADWPLLEEHGVFVGWTPGAITLVTSANWAASVSGYTPLVAATSLDGGLRADDLARFPALQALVGPAPAGTCWTVTSDRGQPEAAITRPPPRAICFEAGAVVAKSDRGEIRTPARWIRGEDATWTAEISADERIRVQLGREKGVAWYWPSPSGRKTVLRREGSAAPGTP